MFDLGLKESHAMVEFGSCVEDSGGEEIFEVFRETYLLRRERNGVDRE